MHLLGEHSLSLHPRAHSSPFHTARCLSSIGSHILGSVGPNRVTVGTPRSTARCFGPESTPTRTFILAISAPAPAMSVAGGTTAFLWKLVPWFRDEVWDIYELVPAFLVGLVAAVAVSLLTRRPEDVDEHFRVMRG